MIIAQHARKSCSTHSWPLRCFVKGPLVPTSKLFFQRWVQNSLQMQPTSNPRAEHLSDMPGSKNSLLFHEILLAKYSEENSALRVLPGTTTQELLASLMRPFGQAKLKPKGSKMTEHKRNIQV